MSKTHLTEQKFSDFALHPKVIEALENKGFHNCTPIQALALPLTLAGRDVAGQAQTGTGKTMAFLTSTFHYLLSHPAIADRKVNQPRALIMAPTRELAVQIHADAEPLAQATGLKLGLAYGGGSALATAAANATSNLLGGTAALATIQTGAILGALPFSFICLLMIYNFIHNLINDRLPGTFILSQDRMNR